MSRILVDEMPKEPKECPFVRVVFDISNIEEKVYACVLRRTLGFNGQEISDLCVGCDECTKLKEYKNV